MDNRDTKSLESMVVSHTHLPLNWLFLTLNIYLISGMLTEIEPDAELDPLKGMQNDAALRFAVSTDSELSKYTFLSLQTVQFSSYWHIFADRLCITTELDR